ncbi:unnamed protein product [Penicillium viridicatum]
MPPKASSSSRKSMSLAPVSSFPMGTPVSPGSPSSSLGSSPTSELPTPASLEFLKDPSLLLKQVYQDAKECLRLGKKDAFWALLAKTEQEHGQISLPLPKVPIGKMTRKEVQIAFHLTRNTTDQAPWMHPPPGTPLPQCALEMLEIVRRGSQRSTQKETAARCVIDILLYSVLDQVSASSDHRQWPLNLEHETYMTSRPILYDTRQYKTSGRADYTLWYRETRRMSEKAINLVIVEAKKEGMVSAGEAQLLGYMGIVHQERKALRKVNAVVYGMSSDGDEFHFYQINNDSEWTTVSYRTHGTNYGKVVDLLTYIMQEAISLSPFVSKNVSAEDDPMTDVVTGLV